uniref:Neur_chan_memb domain-containing protein n=1 Tax=Macrostomum lignano TaxID=282301 RepID=A0A1I8F4Q6_9PLAT
AETAYNLATLSTNAIVQNDGNVSWLSTNIFESACIIDVKYFPFDTQFCNMDFGSWTFSDRELDINFTTEQMDATNYLPSTEWVLKNVTAPANYSCCPDVLFPLVTYQIILQRKPFFYVFNMLLPCIIITYVALLGFSVPADSGEKVTMGITTLLSMTVFLMLVAEQLPPNSKSLPMIGIYYGVAISIVSVATGCTVLTLNVYSMGKKGSPLPGWAKRLVFGVIAKLVFKSVRLLAHGEDSLASDGATAIGHGHRVVYDHTDYSFPLMKPGTRSSLPGHPQAANCISVNRKFATTSFCERGGDGGGGGGGGGVPWQQGITSTLSRPASPSPTR